MKAVFILFVFAFISQIVLSQDSVYTNPIGMKFILIPHGKVQIGKYVPAVPARDSTHRVKKIFSDNTYKKASRMAKKSARDGFSVQIKKAFYMGVYEVTQQEWTKLMGSNPSTFKQADDLVASADFPVETVTVKDILKFISKLNEVDPGKIYRLPTEFEWEYAAGAGYGDDISWKEIRETAVLGGRSTVNVGTKKPNHLGLYDMLGNVWEWTADIYNEKLFADRRPPKFGKTNVLKGASFTGDVKNATFKTHAGGPGNGWDTGFRLVMEQY